MVAAPFIIDLIMKANELMIGDWFRFRYTIDGREKVKTFRISQIENELGEYYVWGNGFGRMCFPERLEPIPLTPEILEKNLGVVERSSDGYKLVINRELILAFHLKATLDFWIAQPSDWPHFTYSLPLPRYVHELQHALRICGIDKEIMI